MVENDLNIIHNKVSFIKLKDNLIENIVKKDSEIDVEDVVQIKKMNLALAEDKPYCVMFIPHEFSSLTNDAREYIATPKIADKTIALAIVTSNFPQRIVANFYLAINKPIVKTKLFSTRDKALEWLNLQLNNHQ